MSSSIQVPEVLFLITTFGFLYLINAYAVIAIYIFFPWFLVPFWMIYDGKKDPNLLKEGVSVIIFLLGIGLIMIFIEAMVPIDITIVTGIYDMKHVKIRPTFLVLALPYLIHKINQIALYT